MNIIIDLLAAGCAVVAYLGLQAETAKQAERLSEATIPVKVDRH